MTSKEDGRKYFTRARREPAFFQCFGRAAWLTDEQWRQAQAYAAGKEIPTDKSIADGFRNCYDRNGEETTTTGARAWVYGSVPAYIVGPQNYDWWCELINEYHPNDPDLQMDEGL